MRIWTLPKLQSNQLSNPLSKQLQTKYNNKTLKSRIDYEDIKITCKKRTGNSPLLLAWGIDWTSLRLVRKANLPSVVEASHVPPAFSSLPPKISAPSHHPSGFVGLAATKESIKTQHNLQIIPPKTTHKTMSETGGKKKKKKECLPAVIFISVE